MIKYPLIAVDIIKIDNTNDIHSINFLVILLNIFKSYTFRFNIYINTITTSIVHITNAIFKNSVEKV